MTSSMDKEEQERMRTMEIFIREGELHREKVNRNHKLKRMLDLANGIKRLHEIYGTHTWVDEILESRLEDYNEDDWNTKIDKLNKLRVTENRRQIESKRYHKFAWANGHLASNLFVFEIEDNKGRVCIFNCGTKSLKELRDAVVSKVGNEHDWKNPPNILYKDEHGDIFILESDIDLIEAIKYARSKKWMKLKLHLEYSSSSTHGDSKVSLGFGSMSFADIKVVTAVLGATATGLVILAYLRRS